ncbi:hypothetical protein GCU49_23590, partial [Modestobacter roseus]|nr:hypothetical protein [Modestobacter roseus]
MARPSDGMAVAVVSYASWADPEQAAEGARVFREEFGPAMGITVTDTANFVLSLATCRCPGRPDRWRGGPVSVSVRRARQRG